MAHRADPPTSAALLVRTALDDDPLPAGADRALLADFVAESREALADAEGALLALEADPDDGDATDTALRAFHTVKGTAGFLGLERVAAVAHHVESLLSRIRDLDLRYSASVADVALQAADLLRDLLDACDAGLRTGRMPLPASYEATLAAVAVAVAAPAATRDPAALGLRRSGRTATARSGDARPRGAADLHASVRIRTATLDALLDLAGELAEAQAQAQARLAGDGPVRDGRDPDLARSVARAGAIAREVQALALSLRLVALEPTFRTLTRLVRDVAQRAGKAVDFVTAGGHLEVDRGLADGIGDPLVHMLRNAVDHGIESPEERARAGKPPRGLVTLHAAKAGAALVLTLRDDGRGLDPDRILAQAIRQGILPPDATPSPQEACRLIFAPGFSMAERVTHLSGRGVGMDVVRTRIAALRGEVGIDSVPGLGTTFTLRLPMLPAAPRGGVAPSTPGSPIP